MMEYGKTKNTLVDKATKEGAKFAQEVSEDIMESPRKDFKKQVVTAIIMVALFALSKMSHFIVITFLTALTINPLLASAFVFAVALLVIGVAAAIFRKRIISWKNDLSGELTHFLDKAYQKELSSEEGKTLYKQITYGSKEHKAAIGLLAEELRDFYDEQSSEIGVDLKNTISGYTASSEGYQQSLERAESFLWVLIKDSGSDSLRKMLTDDDKVEITRLMKKHIAGVKGTRGVKLSGKHALEQLSEDEDSSEVLQERQTLFLQDMALFYKKYSSNELVDLVRASINQLRVHQALAQGKISKILQSTETIPLKDVDRANQLINILSSNFDAKGSIMPRARALGEFFYGKANLNEDQVETLYMLLNKASGGLVRTAMSEEMRNLKESGDAKRAMRSALNNFEFDGLTLPTMINFIQCFDELSERLNVEVPSRAVVSGSINHHYEDDEVGLKGATVPIQQKNEIYDEKNEIYDDDKDDEEDGDGNHLRLQ